MLTVQLANMIMVGQIFTSNAAIVYLRVCFPTPPIPLQVDGESDAASFRSASP